MQNDKIKEFEFIQGLTAELSSRNLIFPTSVQATMQIRHALADMASASVSKVARLVGAEPVLSAQVLRAANSAAMGLRDGRRIADLHSAVTRLGFAKVRNLTIAVGMRQLTQHNRKTELQSIIDGLWTRSLRVASLCCVIARRATPVNPDTALLAGLFHDIGKFYILNRARDYTGLFVNLEAMWNLVDKWHSDIGQAILESWEIPEEICLATRDRADRNRKFGPPLSLTDIVSLADALDARNVFSVRGADGEDESLAQMLAALELGEDMITEFLSAGRQEFEELMQVLS